MINAFELSPSLCWCARKHLCVYWWFCASWISLALCLLRSYILIFQCESISFFGLQFFYITHIRVISKNMGLLSTNTFMLFLWCRSWELYIPVHLIDFYGIRSRHFLCLTYLHDCLQMFVLCWNANNNNIFISSSHS